MNKKQRHLVLLVDDAVSSIENVLQFTEVPVEETLKAMEELSSLVDNWVEGLREDIKAKKS